MKTYLALATGKAGSVLRAVSLLFLLLGMAFVNVAAAAHASWHQESARYVVHLGVVPASAVRAAASHKMLHVEFDRQRSSSWYVLGTRGDSRRYNNTLTNLRPDAGLRRLDVPLKPSDWGVWILSHVDLRATARVRVCREFLSETIEQQRPLIQGEQSRYH